MRQAVQWVLFLVALVLLPRNGASVHQRPARSLLEAAGAPTVSYVISGDGEELLRALDAAKAGGNLSVAFILPRGTLSLSRPLVVPMNATFTGAPAVDGAAPATVLRCAASSMSLIVFNGTALSVQGVQLQECTSPALSVQRGSTATIDIAACAFTRCSRVLPRGRSVDDPRVLSPISNTTAPLAIYAPDFGGQLAITKTTFSGNQFRLAPSAEQQAASPPPPPSSDTVTGDYDFALALPPPPAPRPPRPSPPPAGDYDFALALPPPPQAAANAAATGTGRRRTAEDALAYCDDGVADGGECIDVPAETLTAAEGDSYEEAAVGINPPAFLHEHAAAAALAGGISSLSTESPEDVALSLSQWMSMLGPRSAVAYPALKLRDGHQNVRRRLQAASGPTTYLPGPAEGPLLAAANVIHPNLETGPWADDLEAVVAVTCSTGSACSVSLTDVTFDANTGVSTGALYVLCDGAQSCAVKLERCTVTNNKLLWQSVTDASNLPPLGSGLIEREGWNLLYRMVPWLTYTYPLIDYFQEREKYFKAKPNINDPNAYGNITGRTLGAVVVHQKRAATRADPSSPMMVLNITGGVFSGNDGSAIMSTATDWNTLAGGNGSWSVLPPSHSADVSIAGAIFVDHVSGWPAVWLRWARRASVTSCQASRSTGVVWLDEVRDAASISHSNFSGNSLPLLWLDWLGFPATATGEGITFGRGIGAGSGHQVKVEMTPLGDIPNLATITNCTFQGNPSYMSGSLYIGSTDKYLATTEDLRGKTTVRVEGCTFSGELCRRYPSDCRTGERPLYILQTYEVIVSNCSFLGNYDGGAAMDGVTRFRMYDSVFSGNALTYRLVSSDFSRSGAALFLNNIGEDGGVVQNCTFVNNTSGMGGGAVYAVAISYLVFNRTSFDGNIAARDNGGAVWMQSAFSTQSTATRFTNCTFNGNVAGRSGGAVAGVSMDSEVGWVVEDSRFDSNWAMVAPTSERSVDDEEGGGAIFYETGRGLNMLTSNFTGNRVFRHAGGAVRYISGVQGLTVFRCRFQGNIALLGGALALTGSTYTALIQYSHFGGNSVVDPWVWPDTTTVAPANGTLYADLDKLDAGFGGAIFATSSSITIVDEASFTDNSALVGGAVAVSSSDLFAVQYNRNQGSLIDVPLTSDLASAVGGAASVPARVLFSSNVAALGGAAFFFDVDRLTFSGLQTKATALRDDTIGQPCIVFYNNTANGGGGIAVESSRLATLSGARFIGNTVRAPPLADDYTGLNGRERYNGTTATMPCFSGGGGAVCIAGRQNGTTTLRSTELLSNAAVDGGGVHVADGEGCISQIACHSVGLENVTMTGNYASGRGGAVFWQHEGVVRVDSCAADTTLTLQVSDAASASGIGSTYNVTMLAPGRKGPAAAYARMRLAHRATLLASIGGPINASGAAAYMVNGVLTLSDGYVFTRSLATNGSSDDSGSNVTGLTSGGSFVVAVSAASANSSVQGASTPAILNGTVLQDTAWQGIGYSYLPCSDWSNKGMVGDDIASTPYFLLNEPHVEFYSSNTDILMPVTVHDWLGQHCMGAESVQPLVRVRAQSSEVSGATEAIAQNGTATFTALRLRSKEGPHNVTFSGQATTLQRDLMTSSVLIYVRPCSINEFLSPKNLDECIPCDSGSYNLNVSAVSCQTCPDNADCNNPDPTACATEDCSTSGFMVPQDGYWHSSFFSEQVLECPNPDSCTADNRSDALASIQYQVWQLARVLQYNTSKAAADALVRAASASLVDPSEARRRLQQVKAITDDDYIVALVNATLDLMPTYMQSQCAEGYYGTLCGQCAEGYGWSQEATCVKCPSKALNNLYYALVTLLTLSVLAFTVYTSLKEQRVGGKLVGGMATKAPNRTVSVGGPGPAPPDNPFGLSPVQSAPLSPDATDSLQRRKQPDHEEQTVAVLLDSAHSDKHGAGKAPAPFYEQDAVRLNGGHSYVDPAVAAAVSEFGSKPGTPRGGVVSSAAFLPPSDSDRSKASVVVAETNGSAAANGAHAHVGNGAGPVAEGTEAVQDSQDAQLQHGRHYLHPIPADATHDAPNGSPPHSPTYRSSGGDRAMSRERASHASQYSYMRARKKAHQSTVMKIFVSYVQVLALLQNVPLDIPGVIDVYYRINNQATSYPGMLVSLDCSLPDEPSVSHAMVRVILAVLAPLYVYAGAIIYFLLFNVLDYYVLMPYYAKRKSKRRKKRGPLRLPTFGMHLQDYLPRQLIVTLVTTMFFFYPNVVRSLMSIFECQEVDVVTTSSPLAIGVGLQTESVWSQDYGQTCYTGSHLGLVLGLGLPGVLLIAIGWPLFSGLLVSGKLPCFKRIRFTEDMTEIFLADFKPRWLWWESVVMMRKLAIAIIVTFVDGPASAGVQLLLVVCVLGIAMALNVIIMPYHHFYTNGLEMTSIGVLIVTLYLSLYFSINDMLSTGGRVAISVIILSINIGMVLVFVFYIVQAYWFAALYNTGLADVDSSARKKMSAEEVREKILERRMRNSVASPASTQPGAPPEPADAPRARTMQLRMASIYATAVVAGLRMSNTSSRLLSRMRTALNPQPPSHLVSREASHLEPPAHQAQHDVEPGGSTSPPARHHRLSIGAHPPTAHTSVSASRPPSVAGLPSAHARVSDDGRGRLTGLQSVAQGKQRAQEGVVAPRSSSQSGQPGQGTAAGATRLAPPPLVIVNPASEEA